MEEVRILERNAERNEGDFLGIVNIEGVNTDDRTAWRLVDPIDNHIWLEFGTDNIDYYYPSFIFYYQAKPELKEQIKELIK